jgi:hypothetical protein
MASRARIPRQNFTLRKVRDPFKVTFYLHALYIETTALPGTGRSLFHKVLLAHPRSVGESYGVHLVQAMGIAAQLIGAGAACLVHGLLPILFQRRASQTVATLHQGFVKRGLVRDTHSSRSEI